MKIKALTILTLSLARFIGGCGKKDAGTTTVNTNAAPIASATPLPVATAAAPDTKLTGMIEENLKKAKCDGATVTVVNGKPTVTGEVPAAIYATCIQVIQQAGVSGGVTNELKKGK